MDLRTSVAEVADAALTRTAYATSFRRQPRVSKGPDARPMSDESADDVIRRAIGGDQRAIDWIMAHATTGVDPVLGAMAALLQGNSALLVRAAGLAATSRDRQVVAISGAHLAGDTELVDALARDHLVDHPTSLIVSWIASGAGGRRPGASTATLETGLAHDAPPGPGDDQ
jgi:hypothetical protein